MEMKEGPYQFRGVELSPAIAMRLIKEVMAKENPIHRRPLIERVMDLHRRRGGKPGGDATSRVKRALTNLQDKGEIVSVSHGNWRLPERGEVIPNSIEDAATAMDAASAEVIRGPSVEARQEALHRIEEAEAALRVAKAALQGRMGHNDPDADTASLTPAEQAQAAEELAELRREVEAPTPNRGNVERPLAGITTKARKARAWLTENLSKLVLKDAYDQSKAPVGAWLTHALEQVVAAARNVFPWS